MWGDIVTTVLIIATVTILEMTFPIVRWIICGIGVVILAAYVIYRWAIPIRRNNKAFQHLQKLIIESIQRAILNENLETRTIKEAKSIETETQNSVEIFTFDLSPDLSDLFEVVVTNLKAGKEYKYIFPKSERGRFERLYRNCKEEVPELQKHMLIGKPLGKEFLPISLVFYDRKTSNRKGFLILGIRSMVTTKILEIPMDYVADIASTFGDLWKGLR